MSLTSVRIGMFSAWAVGLALTACAGRDPHPVSVVQPQDAQSDCAMIRAEIEANNVQAQKLADENHAKIAQNVALQLRRRVRPKKGKRMTNEWKNLTGEKLASGCLG